jgi:acetylornithine aminotransferase
MTTAPGTRPRNPAFASLATYPFVRLDEAKASARAKGIRVIDFTIGDPHEETPSRIRERLLRSVPARSSYPPAAGTPALRAAIAGWCARRYGVQLDPERHVLPSNGSKEAVYLIHQAVIDPRGDRRVILIPDPAYPVYEIATRFAGGEAVPVRLEPRLGFLPDLDALPADLLRRTAMMWINYPNNPTGALADETFYRRALALAREHGFWLASDEAYSEIWFDAPPPGALSSGLENLLVFNTLSKRSAMTGYRSGFMAGDPELINLLRKVRPSQGVATPTFVMEAAIEAWGDEEHVADQRRIYREKRDVLRPVLEAKGIEPGGSQATFYLYFRVPAGETSESFAAKLLEHGVAVVPASFFGAGGEGWARMALVPTLAECREAAGILEKIL